MKIPINVDFEELYFAIGFNLGNSLFVVSPDGEIFDEQSTPSNEDIYLPLPCFDTNEELKEKPRGAWRRWSKATMKFIKSLNDPATWKGQTVMGQPVCDVFYFEVQ